MRLSHLLKSQLRMQQLQQSLKLRELKTVWTSIALTRALWKGSQEFCRDCEEGCVSVEHRVSCPICGKGLAEVFQPKLVIFKVELRIDASFRTSKHVCLDVFLANHSQTFQWLFFLQWTHEQAWRIRLIFCIYKSECHLFGLRPFQISQSQSRQERKYCSLIRIPPVCSITELIGVY